MNQMQTECGTHSNQKLLEKTWNSETRTRTLFMRFQTIYAEGWTKKIPNDDVMCMMVEDWSIALDDITNSQIKQALERCRKNDLWKDSFSQSRAPTIEEFVKLCREYDRPMPNMLDFRVVEGTYNDGGATSVAGTLLKPFKERLNDFEEKAKSLKIEHPTWEEKYHDIHSKFFDKKIYVARRQYILRLNVYESFSLETKDRIDWFKYCAEEEAVCEISRTSCKTTPTPHLANGLRKFAKN